MMLSFFYINQNWLAPVYSRVNVNVIVNSYDISHCKYILGDKNGGS